MITHARFQELAATSLDFDLESDERNELDRHLSGCDACRAYADALRRDGIWLRALPAPGAPAHVRRVVLGGSEGRRAPGPRLGTILVVVALIVLPLGAATVFLRGLSFGPGIGAAPAASPPLTAWVRVAGSGVNPGVEPSAAPASAVAEGTAAPTIPPATAGAAETAEPSIPVEGGSIQGLTSVAWSAGEGFVAVGDACPPEGTGCAAAVVLSQDGSAWRRISDPGLTLEPLPCCQNAGMRDVTMFAGGIVAVGAGADGASSQAALWWSDGGTQWSRRPYDAATAGWANGVVAHDDRRVVAVGGDTAEARARAAVWISDDGRTWQRVPDTSSLDAGVPGAAGGDGAIAGMHDVADDGTRFVAVGARCDDAEGRCSGIAWVSADGVTWTASPDAFGFGIPAAISVSDDRFIAVGHDADLPAAWSSADGMTWQPMAVDDIAGAALRAVSSVDAGPIAGGRIDEPPLTGSIWEPQKGIWSPVESGDVFAGSSVEGIAVASPSGTDGAGEIVVAVGRGQPGPLGVIWRLEDGQGGGS